MTIIATELGPVAFGHGVSILATSEASMVLMSVGLLGLVEIRATPLRVQINLSEDGREAIKLIVPDAVVARFRPPNKAELASGGESIVDFETEDTCSINVWILFYSHVAPIGSGKDLGCTD